MSNYVFKRAKMMSGVVDAALAGALVQAGGVNVACPDGALVVLGNLAPDTTYVSTGLEYDTYLATAPAAVTDEVAIVDYAGISEGSIAGNTYKEGIKLYNLTAPAGEIVRARRLYLHDKFWLGDGDFASAPVIGQYAVATVASFLHTPAASQPATGYAIKVLLSEDLTAGMASKGLIYLCEVVQL